ncbi:chitobiase/beta-hexosaminidase C-terminal domain-containing protein [Lachnospiraceae bacterium OttesenSCG-928-D06]|nr:chitobiase/beta-hexosaminidase C-terminal domain-containing protein [Lachnospiraceae bacterium OttesenSCG-928-D06]
MKCPNCGAEMADESLYCENCGEDIHIVPDFEPELEYSMEQTLKGIKKDVLEEERKKRKKEKKDEKSPVKEKQNMEEQMLLKRKQNKWIFIGSASAIVFVAILIGMITLYQYHSYDYQLLKANSSMAESQYESAVKHYQRAMELNAEDVEVSFSLAEAYYLKGNKIQYEYILRGITKREGVSEEQLERAYSKLITIYREKNDYKTINELILDSNSESIKVSYQEYTAPIPEFNYEEGEYEEIIPLKLSVGTVGTIYYTLDGSIPDKSSMIYTAPIFLDDGTHRINAYFVNEYGISSEVVTKEYQIEIEQALAPEVTVISGEYHVPMVIEVISTGDSNIYYSTDGSDPTLNSTLYTRPIYMPLGTTNYKFAYVNEDGSSSQITLRSYRLVLETDLTPGDCESIIVNYVLSTGKILNTEGLYQEESLAKYLYLYQYTATINEDNDYYVIAEYHQTADGVKERTGNFYAVNVYDGSYKKLLIDERNRFTLEEISN